jgi:hypothetical protein
VRWILAETQDLRPELFSAVPAGLVDSRHPYPGLRPGLISDVPTGLKVVLILAISGDYPNSSRGDQWWGIRRAAATKKKKTIEMIPFMVKKAAFRRLRSVGEMMRCS